MELTGRIVGIKENFLTKKAEITLEVNEKERLENGYPSVKDIDLLDVKIVKHRKKRSLDANAYAWQLIGQIADKLRASKDEVYLHMLKRYGQSDYISVLANVDVSRYLKYYELAGTATLQGKEFNHYRAYRGSSDYDSREMSIFIDGIVSEAKDLQIETLTPDEVKRVLSAYQAAVR